jgi:hypothetical protein
VIRIFAAHEPNGVTITVDGQLVDDCVEAVETCVTEAMSLTREVRLYLRDVSHIDARSRSLLVRLAAKGVLLSASGVYSSYIVSEVSRGRTKVPATERESLPAVE